MGRACDTRGGEERWMCVSVGNYEGMRMLVRTGHRWEDNIKIDVKRWECMAYFLQAEDGNMW